MPRKKQSERRKWTDEPSRRRGVQRFLEVVLFTALLIGGATIVWNEMGGLEIHTGKMLTLGNLGFLMLGIGWLRLQMLLFPNSIPAKNSRKRKRFGGHWADSHDD